MDLAMKEKTSKLKSDMVPTEKEKNDCAPLSGELRCFSLKLQELKEELKCSADLLIISLCGVNFRFEETVIDTCMRGPKQDTLAAQVRGQCESAS